MAKQKRHIDKKKVRNTILWSLLMIAIAILMYLSIQKQTKAPLQKVYISISKEENSQYVIKKKDIVTLIENDLGYGLESVVMEELRLRHLEQILTADSRVRRAEVFVDGNYRLHIYVEQRRAVVRVKTKSADYYIDDEGSIMSASLAHTCRVPIVTGNVGIIPDSFPYNEQRVPLNDVYEIGKATAEDEFLEALVEQIHVDNNNEVWMIPKVGKEKLLLGDAKELDDRMQRLKIIYKEGMKRSGFNQYAELHFKWKGQVTRKGRLN